MISLPVFIICCLASWFAGVVGTFALGVWISKTSKAAKRG
jgi:hypothetical protein